MSTLGWPVRIVHRAFCGSRIGRRVPSAAENVRMGIQQAVREGKWINRPKTGYDLIDGSLVPNDMAPIVRRIFTMRGEGASLGDIARAMGVNYSLVREILHSRI